MECACTYQDGKVEGMCAAHVAAAKRYEEAGKKFMATKRPECFAFAMDFLGDPEASEIIKYVEHLENEGHKKEKEDARRIYHAKGSDGGH